MIEVIHKELSYIVCGLCFKTHNALGRYKKEKIYADYFETLLKIGRIEYVREKPLKPEHVGERFRRNIPDFIIENKIVVDFKAKRTVGKEDYYQMKRYLSSSGLRLGLLVNFRQEYLLPKRILANKVAHS